MNFEDRVTTVVEPLIRSLEEAMLDSDVKAHPEVEDQIRQTLSLVEGVKSEVKHLEFQISYLVQEKEEEKKEEKDPEEKEQKKEVLKDIADSLKSVFDKDNDGHAIDDVINETIDNDPLVTTLKVLGWLAKATSKLIPIVNSFRSVSRIKEVQSQISDVQNDILRQAQQTRDWITSKTNQLDQSQEALMQEIITCCQNQTSGFQGLSDQLDMLQGTTDDIHDAVDGNSNLLAEMSGKLDEVHATTQDNSKKSDALLSALDSLTRRIPTRGRSNEEGKEEENPYLRPGTSIYGQW